MNNFGIKKKIIEAGESTVLADWQKISTITKEDFLEAVEWVCQDKLNDKELLTREIGLEPDRIVKLRRGYIEGTNLSVFYRIDTGMSWDGAVFSVEPESIEETCWTDGNGKLVCRLRLSLSARDQV